MSNAITYSIAFVASACGLVGPIALMKVNYNLTQKQTNTAFGRTKIGKFITSMAAADFALTLLFGLFYVDYFVFLKGRPWLSFLLDCAIYATLFLEVCLPVALKISVRANIHLNSVPWLTIAGISTLTAISYQFVLLFVPSWLKEDKYVLLVLVVVTICYLIMLTSYFLCLFEKSKPKLEKYEDEEDDQRPSMLVVKMIKTITLASLIFWLPYVAYHFSNYYIGDRSKNSKLTNTLLDLNLYLFIFTLPTKGLAHLFAYLFSLRAVPRATETFKSQFYETKFFEENPDFTPKLTNARRPSDSRAPLGQRPSEVKIPMSPITESDLAPPQGHIYPPIHSTELPIRPTLKLNNKKSLPKTVTWGDDLVEQ